MIYLCRRPVNNTLFPSAGINTKRRKEGKVTKIAAEAAGVVVLANIMIHLVYIASISELARSVIDSAR